jgi:hypothetical protein
MQTKPRADRDLALRLAEETPCLTQVAQSGRLELAYLKMKVETAFAAPGEEALMVLVV